MKIKTKLTFGVGLVVFVAFAITIMFVGFRVKKVTENFAEKSSEQMAYRYGGEIHACLEDAMNTARNLAHVFEGIKKSNPDRAVMNSILKQVLENNSLLLGTWTVWEPNALDGRDQEFANSEGHDATGRFVPYWNRGAGAIALEPAADYETKDGSGYYVPVKKSGEETILEPYVYNIKGKDILMTSMAVPIKIDGKVVGVAGVDISLSSLEKMVDDIKPYETGYAFIMSNSGLMVSHPDKASIGKDAVQRQPDNIQEAFRNAVKQGKQFNFFKKSIVKGTDHYFVVSPIAIGESKTPWSFAISVPMDTIRKEARDLTYSIITIGIIAVALVAFMITILANSIVRPIRKVVSGLKDIAEGEGDLTKRLNITSGDEIGELALWFDRFIGNLQGIIKKTVDNARIMDSSSTELFEIAASLAKGTEETSNLSKNVSGATETMTQNITAVASAMEQSTTNLSMVAVASEEMTSTINEITVSSERARSISDNALVKAREAYVQMEELGKAAHDISKVTETINDISDQTNLLALNATIEAARAGEAGKGFAVVAGEIKDLAGQTSKATQDIKARIDGIQSTTQSSVDKIKSITTVVEDINSIINVIAASVEEQSATTTEISNNIAQVTEGVKEVNRNVGESSSASMDISHDISKVNKTAVEGARSSAQLKIQSEKLKAIGKELQTLLCKFNTGD